MSKRNSHSFVDEPTRKITKIEQDGRLQLRNSPNSLQSICNNRIAIELWYHQNVRHLTKKLGYCYDDVNTTNKVRIGVEEQAEYYSKHKYSLYYDEFDYECKTCSRVVDFSVNSLKEQVENSLSELTLPLPLVPGIRKCIPSIGSAIDEWVNYQHQRIFFDLRKSLVYKHVDEIVWNSNGTINYAESGKSMLLSLKINQVEKYRIICTYCLEDEFKNLPQSLFCSKYFEKVTLKDHPLIYYWNCVAKDKLEKILIDGVSSVESRMIKSLRVDNECAIMYFLEHLTEEDKVEKVKLLITRYGIKYQKMLINCLTEIQQQHLFLDMGVDIVLNFAKLSNSSKHALSSWIFMRNLVTKEQHVDVISRLLNLAIDDYFGSTSQIDLYALLTGIWKTSSAHCKQFALNCNDNFLIKKIMGSRYLEKNMKLLQEMLSDARNDLRRNIISSDFGRKLCENQIKNSRLSLLDCFIKLCLPDANEASKFRSELLKSEFFADHCLDLCVERKYLELNASIRTLSENLSATNEYLARLLNTKKSIAKFARMLQLLDNVSFKDAVNQLLPNSNTAANFLRSVALSRNTSPIFFNMVKNGELDKVNDYVNQLLSNKDEVKRVKHALLDFIRGREMAKMFVTLDENSCRKFLLWCVNSEENLSNFKKSLPFEDMFLSMFKESIFTTYDSQSLHHCTFRNPISFLQLDRFLKWFFDTSEEIKRFKIAKINNFEQIEPICLLMKKIDESHLKTVCDWFFSGDVQQIERFKTMHRGSQIADLF